MLSVFIFFIAVLITGIIFLHSNFFKRYLIQKLDSYLKDKYSLSLSIKSLDYSLMRFSFTLDEVKLEGVHPSIPISRLESRRVYINLSPIFMLSRKPHFQKIEILHPRFIIVEKSPEEDDSVAKKQRKKATPENALSFRIDELSLHDGFLQYNNEIIPLNGSLSSISLEIGYSDHLKIHSGSLEAQKGEIFFRGSSLDLKNFLARFKFNEEMLSLDFSSHLARGKVAADFRLALRPKRHFSAALTWDSVDLSSFLAGLPEFPFALATKTYGSIKASGSGFDLNNIDASGHVSFDSSSFAFLKESDFHTSDGKVAFDISQGSVNIQRSFLSFDGDVVHFSGNMDEEKNLRGEYLLTIDDVSKTMKRLLPMMKLSHQYLEKVHRLNPQGMISISGRIGGKTQNPEFSVDLSGKLVALETFSIKSLDASLIYKEGQLAISRFKARPEQGLLDISGFIDFNPFAKSFGEKTRLTLRMKDIDIKPPAKLIKPSFLLEGSLSGESEFKGNLLSPAVHLKGEIKNFVIEKEAIPHLQFAGTMQDKKFRMESLALLQEAGTIKAEASLDLSKKQFFLKGMAERIVFKNIQSLPLEKYGISGEGNFQLEGKWTLEKPEKISGEVRIDTIKLGYQNLWLENPLPIRIAVHGEDLYVHEFRLLGPETEFILSGNYPLTSLKEGNLQVKGKINAKLFEPFIPGAELGGYLFMNTEIKGNLSEPAIGGTLELQGGRARHPLILWEVHDAHFRVLFDEDSVKFEDFSSGLDEGKISIRGSLSLPSLFSEKKQSVFFKKTEPKAIEIIFSEINIAKLSSLFLKSPLYEWRGVSSGKIELTGILQDIRQLEMEGEINQLTITVPIGTVENKEPLHFSIKEGLLRLEESRLVRGKSILAVVGIFDILKKELDAHLSVWLDNSEWGAFLNNFDIGGSTSIELILRGRLPNLEYFGSAEFKNGSFGLLDSLILAEEIEGKIELTSSSVAVTSFKGILNGGPFRIGGKIEYKDKRLGKGWLEFSSRSIQLNYPEGLSSRFNITLRLEGENQDWLLSGDIQAIEAFYGADVHPGAQLLNVFRNRHAGPKSKLPPYLRDIRLAVNVSVIKPLIIDNNLASIEFDGQIRISGPLENPAFAGQIRNKYVGQTVFGNRIFQVETARMEFAGTEKFDPLLDFAAHTKLTHRGEELEIKVNISGPLSNLNYSFSSFPPRSQEEIALLLLTGRGFDEIKGNIAPAIGSQIVQYFASPLTSPLTETLKRLLKAEEVSIEPINIATEADPGARFTFKKRLSREASLVYSADLSNTQRQTLILDYQIGRNFAIRSFRRDDGIYGSSLRHRLNLSPSKPKSLAFIEEQRKKTVVKEIKFEGELIFPAPTLLGNISLRKNSPFEYSLLRLSIDNLLNFYKKKGYLNASVTSTLEYKEKEDVLVSFHVQPGTPIKIIFEGDALAGRLEKKIVDSWKGKASSDIALNEARNFLIDELHKKGFYKAEVETKAISEASSTSYIFYVKKGKSYRIGNFYLEGNKALSSQKIANALKRTPGAKARGLWILIYDFKNAKDALENLYSDSGYQNIRVSAPGIVENHKTGIVDISLRIDEGPQSKVKSVTFRGNTIFPEEELERGLRLVEGEIYRPACLAEDRNYLTSMYAEKGYISLRIEATVIEEKNSADVHIVYSVDEGSKYLVEEIEILGARRTSDLFIIKNLDFKKGETLNLSRLYSSQNNLYRTGIFRTVNISSQPFGGEEEKAKVVIEVEEEPLLPFAYGLRYNSEEKLEGFGELGFVNLFGRGRKGLLYYRQNNLEKNLRLTMENPSFLGKKILSLYSFYYHKRKEYSFVTDELGLSIEQQVRLPYDFSLSYLYRFNRIHTYESEPLGPFPFDFYLFLPELSFSLLRDTRDNRLDATQGSFFSTNFTYSPKLLKSDLPYISIFSQYSVYKRIFPNFVWASNYRVGMANAFDQVLIRSRRFFAGGGNSLRGFRRDAVGPYDPYLERGEGGEALFVINQELRFPLFGGLGGVIFYDMGNVYENLGDFNPFKLRQSAGLGIRLNTALGLLRLDYGLNLFRHKGEPKGLLFFSLGQAF